LVFDDVAEVTTFAGVDEHFMMERFQMYGSEEECRS